MAAAAASPAAAGMFYQYAGECVRYAIVLITRP